MDEIIDATPGDLQQLRIARQGARFGNNIADLIVFYVLLFLQSMVLDSGLGLIPEEGSDWLAFYFVFFYIMYFTVFEYLCGKTPGKFLTRTKVVKQDGSRPEFLNLFGRNAARLIPFDALSYLFLDRGWHDQLSGTYVVYEDDRS